MQSKLNDSTAVIYCDGACAGNGSRNAAGGWGALLKHGGKTKTLSGGERNTTNQRMELTACIRALEELKGKGLKVEVYSDSAYLVNCFGQRWHVKWLRNGWKNARGQPVENRDLWERLLGLTARHNVSFFKVYGHSGDVYNDMADQLARKGIPPDRTVPGDR